MTFEFLVVCRGESATDLDTMLLELLSETLEANQYDFDDYVLLHMVQITHRRESYSESSETGSVRHTLVGFTVELDDVDVCRTVVDEFADSLVGFGPISHAIRFEDPLLQKELGEIGTVIFKLEMKLRRVLAFIYLHARPDKPLDLLQKDQVKPITPNLTEQQMRSVMENQFFHLTFSQYIQLNQPPTPSPRELLGAMLESETYDSLRAKLLGLPIVHEADVVLLSNLKELMDPIEKMRNCVAHNRRPNTGLREDYAVARPRLEERLDQYLADLEVSYESGGSLFTS